MILFWGRADEAPLTAVRRAVANLGAPQVFLDEDFADHTLLSADGDSFGTIRFGATHVQLEDVSAAYLRPYGPGRLQQRVAPSQRAAAEMRAATVGAWLSAWADVAPGTMLNRPSLMASNDSKPVQSAALAALGFRVPDTLVTTSPEAAAAFLEAHDNVIYKSVGSVRSIVAKIAPSERARLDRVACCPTQFQAYVPGVDVRVHVVGERAFACEIRSAAADYRYSGREGASTEIRACALPALIEERCLATAVAFGLPLCGIDLRRTPEGEWYAFEVNPSPGFTYFADAADQPVAEAIADLLTRRTPEWEALAMLADGDMPGTK